MLGNIKSKRKIFFFSTIYRNQAKGKLPTLEQGHLSSLNNDMKEKVDRFQNENERLFFKSGFEEIQKLFQKVSQETMNLNEWNDLSIEMIMKSNSTLKRRCFFKCKRWPKLSTSGRNPY